VSIPHIKRSSIAAYVATEGGVAKVDGQDVVFRAGETRVRPNHPILKVVPSLFEGVTDRDAPFVEPRPAPVAEPVNMDGQPILRRTSPEGLVVAKTDIPRTFARGGVYAPMQAGTLAPASSPVVQARPKSFRKATPADMPA
jgi:hypothetical protein